MQGQMESKRSLNQLKAALVPNMSSHQRLPEIHITEMPVSVLTMP